MPPKTNLKSSNKAAATKGSLKKTVRIRTPTINNTRGQSYLPPARHPRREDHPFLQSNNATYNRNNNHARHLQEARTRIYLADYKIPKKKPAEGNEGNQIDEGEFSGITEFPKGNPRPLDILDTTYDRKLPKKTKKKQEDKQILTTKILAMANLDKLLLRISMEKFHSDYTNFMLMTEDEIRKEYPDLSIEIIKNKNILENERDLIILEFNRISHKLEELYGYKNPLKMNGRLLP